MSKKMLLFVLATMSTLLALPAFASALPAHLSSKPETFNLHGGASVIARAAGTYSTYETTTGSGSFESTTTGTLKMTFHGSGGCTASTTTLPFHLVMIETSKPGILITAAAGGHFGSTCFLFPELTGNGILGSIAHPKCGQASNTIVVRFTGAAGVQTPQAYTGTNYFLASGWFGGGKSPTSISSEVWIAFAPGVSPTLICTH